MRSQAQIETEIAEYRQISKDALAEIKRLTAEAGELARQEQRKRLKRRKYAWYGGNDTNIPYGHKVTIEKVNRKWVIVDAGKFGRWNVLPTRLYTSKPSDDNIRVNKGLGRLLRNL